MKLLLWSIVLLISSYRARAQSEPADNVGSAPVLVSVDARGIDALRAQYKGKVLVLNLWATWCTPCKEEFPEFVKLNKTYAGRGAAVVFVSIDEDDAKAKKNAVSFLRRHNAPLPSYIKASGDDEQFITAVHPQWSGAVPATFVYGRNGNLVTMRVEGMNFSELEKTLLPLLN